MKWKWRRAGSNNVGYNPSLAVPYFRPFAYLYTLNNETKRILNNNPTRVALEIWYTNIAVIPGVTIGDGNQLSAGALFSLQQTFPFRCCWYEFASRVTLDWYASTTAFGATISVVEVTYAPAYDRLQQVSS